MTGAGPHMKDEMDWKDLRRVPTKLFGYSYLYVLGVLVFLGALYASNITVIGKNSVAPVVLADSSAFVKDIPLQNPRTIPPVDLVTASQPTPEALSRGRDLFKANCASCHGDNGQGDGASGLTLNPRPRNFHSLEGWVTGATILQIYTTLQDGITKSGMPSFSYLPPADLFALIHLVRSFALGPPNGTPDELRMLDARYQLAKGVQVEGQIPVAKAMRIIIAEGGPSVVAVGKACADAAGSTDPGAALLVGNSYDVQRAMTTLPALARRTGIRDFVRAVSDAPLAMGMHPRVTRLSTAEWTALYNYVSEALK
jgi:mono/diheme cytochrome c family protein